MYSYHWSLSPCTILGSSLISDLWNSSLPGALSSVHLVNCVQLFATPWTAACQASLSISNSQILLKLMSIESLIPSNHLILCHPLLLMSSIFPNTQVFYNESVLRITWPKYLSFSFSIVLPMNAQDWSLVDWTGWMSLQSKGHTQESPPTPQFKCIHS